MSKKATFQVDLEFNGELTQEMIDEINFAIEVAVKASYDHSEMFEGLKYDEDTETPHLLKTTVTTL